MIYRVIVVKKANILDPEGQTIKENLNKKGYKFIEDIRVGKIYDINVKDTENVESKIAELSKSILSNPLIEEFKIEKLESK